MKHKVRFGVDPLIWQNRSLWIWVGTLVVFALLITYLINSGQTHVDAGTKWLWPVMVADVVLGILAFLAMFIFKATEMARKNK